MNYIELNPSVFSYKFAYFDVDEFFADSFFIERRIKVKFMGNMKKDDSDYVIVFCRIKKKDREAFLTCLNRLENKMLLCRHTDYLDFCKEQMKEI